MNNELSVADFETLQELAYRAKNNKTDKTTKKDSIAHLLKLDLIDATDNGVFLVYRPNLNGYNVLKGKEI